MDGLRRPKAAQGGPRLNKFYGKADDNLGLADNLRATTRVGIASLSTLCAAAFIFSLVTRWFRRQKMFVLG
ncbi:MAG: hypothetical protein JKY92_05440 [Magnetovibrio sp.]|nr:hypothetical protein [Magnetovibrio sp.]